MFLIRNTFLKLVRIHMKPNFSSFYSHEEKKIEIVCYRNQNDSLFADINIQRNLMKFRKVNKRRNEGT